MICGAHQLYLVEEGLANLVAEGLANLVAEGLANLQKQSINYIEMSLMYSKGQYEHVSPFDSF